MRLQDKVALITGSTHGIGRATALLFAAEGARVMVSGRNAQAGAEVVGAIRAAGGQADCVVADISDEAQVEHLIARTVETFGGLHVLMNNASPTEHTRGPTRIDASVADLNAERWHGIMDVTLYGTFLVSRYGIPAMLESGGGSVINVSSMTSVRAVADAAAYSTAKAGMNGLTRSIAASYGRQGIRANALIVGLVLTSDVARAAANNPDVGPLILERQLIDHWGQPEDIAHAALFLASDESAFVTGAELVIDGGVSVSGMFPSGALGRQKK